MRTLLLMLNTQRKEHRSTCLDYTPGTFQVVSSVSPLSKQENSNSSSSSGSGSGSGSSSGSGIPTRYELQSPFESRTVSPITPPTQPANRPFIFSAGGGGGGGGRGGGAGGGGTWNTYDTSNLTTSTTATNFPFPVSQSQSPSASLSRTSTEYGNYNTTTTTTTTATTIPARGIPAVPTVPVPVPSPSAPAPAIPSPAPAPAPAQQLQFQQQGVFCPSCGSPNKTLTTHSSALNAGRPYRKCSNAACAAWNGFADSIGLAPGTQCECSPASELRLVAMNRRDEAGRRQAFYSCQFKACGA
ncbi:hypothetical protein ACJQWK_09532 [Exserohilum turcicum]